MSKLVSNLPKISASMAALSKLARNDAAEYIIGLVHLNVPVRTGNLRDSYRKGESSDPNETVVGSDVVYAPFVEYGTYKMAAQPHLIPAFHAAGEHWEVRWAAHLKAGTFSGSTIPGKY